MAFAAGALLASMIWLSVHGEAAPTRMPSLAAANGAEQTLSNSNSPGAVQSDGKLAANLPAEEGAAARQHGGGQAAATPEAEKAPVPEKKPLTSAVRYAPQIRVYLTEEKAVENVSLEVYVKGVVAAEMPQSFEPAALEAQALAARTYIIRRLWFNDRSGLPVEEADVVDTQMNQVYLSLAKMKKLREENKTGWDKVNEAVTRTAGEVITYGDQPIEALYFSTSNGFTENSEEVFKASLPYLRSVASPWDKQYSPRAEEKVELSLADFYRELGVDAAKAGNHSAGKNDIRILERTDGKRVKRLAVGSTQWTGDEVRRKLGLRSAAFVWSIQGDKITLTTYGSGHGVGMSQWGAEGMAKEGRSAGEIIKYYYSGTSIEKVSKLLGRTGKRL